MISLLIALTAIAWSTWRERRPKPDPVDAHFFSALDAMGGRDDR